MATLTPTTKASTATFLSSLISGLLTYFVAENNTIYLVGSSETDYLITQDVTTFTNPTRNTSTLSATTKN